MHSKRINHSFPSFTHVVELDLYFENPEMIEGEKQTGSRITERRQRLAHVSLPQKHEDREFTRFCVSAAKRPRSRRYDGRKVLSIEISTKGENLCYLNIER